MQHVEASVLKIRRLARPGLAPVDLDLGAGECAVLAGPSGSGKTLFMRAVADLDPNEGEVFVGGDARNRMPAPEWRRRVGYVPAEAGWWADRVADHFVDVDIARPLVARLGLGSEALEWRVARLSTGEKQRLALARVLVSSPRVLLLDEPTSGLDPETESKVESILHEKLASGAAILLVSHDIRQAERMARSRYRMEAGTLMAMAAPAAPSGVSPDAPPGTSAASS